MLPSWPLPEFDPSQIRLIVYQDCERRGRNVLFDSSAKRKIEDVSVSIYFCEEIWVRILAVQSLDKAIRSSQQPYGYAWEGAERGQRQRYSEIWSMDESFNLSDDSSGPSPGIVRKKKIAIGVIFSLSRDEDENNKFNEFFFSHFPLFESHMNKLKSAIEQAMKMSRRSADASQRSLAYNRIVDALNEFR
ncbi:hypothetical protein llap_13338 [Limosa lapponica baueri]|uniref:UDENN FNIP1/2-type domain-containing protein n=1 Tax=Limosa lapponica baueri TaxID=1758121 RepID=A0A2I0TRC7_LIMLA|nr:hypothetical protein llap_13338 [Limosa lapponica baueri]